MPAGRPTKYDPAEKIERRNLESLIPFAKNSRTHSPEQVAQIAASITEWGWTTPVLIDETGMIIAGHGRVLAARKLGLTDVPVVVATDWSDAKKRAYVIADNKLALNAGWDHELLALELSELGELGFDLHLTGFDSQEIAILLDDEEKIKDIEELDYKEVFSVIIECENEQEQEKIFNKLDAEGYKCRAQSL
jgi:ParB-like chromosome segregation protein Spo0J